MLQELQKKSTEKLSSMEQELTSIRDKIKEVNCELL